MIIADQYRDAIIELYIAFFNRVPEASGLSYWIDVFNQDTKNTAEKRLASISDEFYKAAIQFSAQTGYSNLTTASDFVKTLYANVLGRTGNDAPSADDVRYWSVKLENRDLTRAELVQQMLKDAKAFAGDPSFGYVADNLQNKLEAGIDHAVVKGINYNSLDEAVLRGKQYLSDYVEWQNLASSTTQSAGSWYQIGDTLYGNSSPAGAVLIDLSLDKLTDAGATQSLAKGSLYYAKGVDVSLLNTPKATVASPNYAVTIIGDAQANVIKGSNLGDSIQAGKGNDIISLGSGADRLIFADSASNNGIDEIHGFKLGKDIIDVSAFLNATEETPNIVEAAFDATQSRKWQNGDILVLQGNGITTAAAIAQQFGNGKAYMNPTTSAKAIVLTADVTGDTQMWYLANQTGLSVITANEITQVATFKGMNNLLTQDTLTSLAASMAAYKPAGILTLDKTTVRESVNNNGSITERISITLTGDNFTGKIGGILGTVENAPDMVVQLVKVSDTQADLVFVGRAKSHGFADSIDGLAILFSATDFKSGSVPVIPYFDDITVEFFDIYAQQVGSTLTVKNTVLYNTIIDLANDQVFFNGKKSGVFGDIRQVTTVDLRDAIGPGPASLTVVGDVVDEIIYASNVVDGTYAGGAGNDTIHLSRTGDFRDTIYFYTVNHADSTKNNGTDTITGFKIGATAAINDRLDFTQFLTKPSKTNLTPIDAIANAAGNAAWANGDILLVQGDFVDTAGNSVITKDSIAALFGGALAAPTNQANLVIIAADIIGDATVWAVSNHGDGANGGLDSISTDEVHQIATLVGINNLVLNPLVANNFV